MARAMSFTLISGLHGFPSLRMPIFFEAIAPATKSFRTKSNLNLGLHPQAVENLRLVTLNRREASGSRSFSVNALDLAYAVNGFSADFSVRALSSAAPYMLQLEAKINDLTPAAAAFLAKSMLER